MNLSIALKKYGPLHFFNGGASFLQQHWQWPIWIQTNIEKPTLKTTLRKKRLSKDSPTASKTEAWLSSFTVTAGIWNHKKLFIVYLTWTAFCCCYWDDTACGIHSTQSIFHEYSSQRSKEFQICRFSVVNEWFSIVVMFQSGYLLFWIYHLSTRVVWTLLTINFYSFLLRSVNLVIFVPFFFSNTGFWITLFSSMSSCLFWQNELIFSVKSRHFESTQHFYQFYQYTKKQRRFNSRELVWLDQASCEMKRAAHGIHIGCVKINRITCDNTTPHLSPRWLKLRT